MSSFRDALGGLKTSSATLPMTNNPETESSGFFSSLREGTSSFVTQTGTAVHSGFSRLGGSGTPGVDSSTGEPVSTHGEWFGLTLFQRWMGFAGCAVLALFCFLLAFMSLPMMIVSPQKFATAFSLGGLATISGIALLRGPRAHTKHMLSKQRLAFTVTYFGSVFGTLFFSTIAHTYLGTLVFVCVQVVALVWYVVSYFPGGSAGLQSTTMNLAGGARTLLPF